MGWLGTLLGGSGGATNIISAAGEAAKNIEDVFRTSDRERLDQYKAETERIVAEGADRAGQRAINLAEARHKSVFVAGWRPFVGWSCGFAVVYHFLVFPLIGPFIEQFTGVALYDLDWQELSILLGGMLGFGGARTYEKLKGVSREQNPGRG